MWSNGALDAHEAVATRLEDAHRGRHATTLLVLAGAVVAFIAWANLFQIDEVAVPGRVGVNEL